MQAKGIIIITYFYLQVFHNFKIRQVTMQFQPFCLPTSSALPNAMSLSWKTHAVSTWVISLSPHYSITHTYENCLAILLLLQSTTIVSTSTSSTMSHLTNVGEQKFTTSLGYIPGKKHFFYLHKYILQLLSIFLYFSCRFYMMNITTVVDFPAINSYL